METRRRFLLTTTIVLTTIAGCGAPRTVAWIQRSGVEQRYVISRVIPADEIATRIYGYHPRMQVTTWHEVDHDLVFIGPRDNVQMLFRIESDGSMTRIRTYTQDRWFEKAIRQAVIDPLCTGN